MMKQRYPGLQLLQCNGVFVSEVTMLTCFQGWPLRQN